MILLIALVGGIALAGAVVLAVTGLRKVPVQPRRPRPSIGQLWARYTRRPAGKAGRRRDLQLAGSVALGFGDLRGHRLADRDPAGAGRGVPAADPARPGTAQRSGAAGGVGPVGAASGDHPAAGPGRGVRDPGLPVHRATADRRRGR